MWYLAVVVVFRYFLYFYMRSRDLPYSRGEVGVRGGGEVEVGCDEDDDGLCSLVSLSIKAASF